MNLIFGTTGTAIDSLNESQINRYLNSSFSKTANFVVKEKSILVGLLNDCGVIQGFASSSKTSVYILGNVHYPLPNWKQPTSPLDAPNLAAEYLLNRYETDGENFLDSVTGQYAILLIDHGCHITYLGTDPAGMRTWYVFETKDGLFFSTHLHTLSKMLGNNLKIDRSQEDFFLMYGFYPHNGTPYEGVYSLPHACLLSFDSHGIHKKKIKYSNPWKNRNQFHMDSSISLQTLTNQLYDEFMTALEEQSSGEKRAAVLLGGFDSALVASALQRLGKEVETFSFLYENSQFNQPHTDTLSKYLGIQHHWVQITQDIFIEGLRHFAERFNQPTNWPNYVIQTAHLAHVIRDSGINYCYTGDGCDTIFLGYPGTHKRAVLLDSLPQFPYGAVKLLIGIFGRNAIEKHLGHPYRVFLNLLRSLGREKTARGFVSFRILDEVSLRQLRQDQRPRQAMEVEQLLHELSEPFRELPTLRLAYLGKSLVSPNKNKIIGSSDQNGIAILSPYLHPGLKAFASSLPESLCRPNEDTPSNVTGKYILMKMAEDKQLLPTEVIYQQKVAGVDGPIDEWYAGPLNKQVLELLTDLPFEANVNYLQLLAKPKLAENIFKEKIMVDNVISHALSLLITYSNFTKHSDLNK